MELFVAAEKLTFGWTTVITLIGLIFGFYQYFSRRSEQKSAAVEIKLAQAKADSEKSEAVKCAAEAVAKTQGREEGTILTQLGAANKGISDIQSEMRRMEDKRETQHLELSTRMTAVEGKASSAHHRIDSLEEAVNSVKNKKTKGEVS